MSIFHTLGDELFNRAATDLDLSLKLGRSFTSCFSSTSFEIVPHRCTTCSAVLAGRFSEKREGKGASHSFDTLDPDLPPLLFDELRRQIESQSQPWRIPLGRIADAIEPFEDPGLLIGRDTSPTILYPHCHQFFGDQT